MSRPDRVLLLLPMTSYKAEDFLAAAEQMGIEVVVGGDRRQALETTSPGNTLTLDFARPDVSVARIQQFACDRPIDAVVGADDETALLAALASESLGLRHNPVEAVRASRDKFRSRELFAAAGLRSPAFRRIPLAVDAVGAAGEVSYPCVLKPLFLSASRGVVRANGPEEFTAAFETIGTILAGRDVGRRGGDAEHLLVEDYIPGDEVALEGLLDAGRLRVLTLFDKPDPMEGPSFERVTGLPEAKRVPGVVEITLTVHRGTQLAPPPEGHRYLGFIFARGDTPETVERALRQAHSRIELEID